MEALGRPWQTRPRADFAQRCLRHHVIDIKSSSNEHQYVRTTLTLDEDVAALLKRLAPRVTTLRRVSLWLPPLLYMAAIFYFSS